VAAVVGAVVPVAAAATDAVGEAQLASAESLTCEVGP
jgi:hypothetical protein